MRASVLICSALLCVGCDKTPRHTAPGEVSQRHTILDEVLAKPQYSNSIVEAQRDLPTDKWESEPYHHNASRDQRERSVATQMLAEVKPHIREMSVSNLVGSFKLIAHRYGILTNNFEGVAGCVYAIGNQLIINELKSRPFDDLAVLRKLGNDNMTMYEGEQGFDLPLTLQLNEIIEDLRPTPTTAQ